jgi:RHS repeat-associated protein
MMRVSVMQASVFTNGSFLRRHSSRKASWSSFHCHRLRNQGPSQSSRTCFEGPFGELLRATGPMAMANPFRFSTKYQDGETDLLYYGYRYYNASTGRWNSRDPLDNWIDVKGRYDLLRSCGMGEKSANKVAGAYPSGTEYCVNRNDCLYHYDAFGLACVYNDSGPGQFYSNVLDHNMPVGIETTTPILVPPIPPIPVPVPRPLGPASSLTFTLRCPKCQPNLLNYRLGYFGDDPPARWTPHGHTFPDSWTDVSLNSQKESTGDVTYTLVVNVPTTDSIANNIGLSSSISGVYVLYLCCDEYGPPYRAPGAAGTTRTLW